MLTLLTRKICPIMTVALFTVSCGKKISESESGPASTVENQEFPSTYVLQLDANEGSRKLYQMPYNGSFKIPSQLRVRQGNALNKIVEARYEANPNDNFDFQIKCTYTGTTATSMNLTSCIDYDNDSYDLEDISNHSFGLYKNQYIELRFSGPSADGLVIDSIHDVKWTSN